MTNVSGTILALDVGTVRVGVSIASAQTKLPRPLVTLSNDDSLADALKSLVQSEQVGTLVVGLPRGLDGQETPQTNYVRTFTDTVLKLLDLPIVFQDEALSSQRARAELEARAKSYVKGDVDALAANFILEDYLLDSGTQHV